MYSKELAKKMKEYLESIKCKYIFDEETGGFEFGYITNRKIGKIYFAITVGESAYNIAAYLEDLEVTAENISAVSEYVHRFNNIIHRCRMEFDLECGGVFCTQMLNCNGVTPCNEMIGECISEIRFSVKYCDGLIDVIEGIKTPKEVFDEYEKEILKW